MKRSYAYLCLAALSAFLLSPASAQRTTKDVETFAATYADVYCSGFISDKPPISGLFVVSAAEGGFKQNNSERDTIYLSRGAGYVVNPGGVYMLLRPVKDPVRTEAFEGQNALITTLGQMYAQIGRIKVNIVHDQTATAEVEQVCSEIQAGDIAVPFNQQPMPRFERGPYDRFAPRSGKNDGAIVIGKDFQSNLGTGNIVYLNIGANNGVEVGQKYRIFRTYLSATKDRGLRYLNNTPTHLGASRYRYQLTREQQMSLPRDILGEMVILSVQGRSATALINKAGALIVPGDEIEQQ